MTRVTNYRIASAENIACFIDRIKHEVHHSEQEVILGGLSVGWPGKKKEFT